MKLPKVTIEAGRLRVFTERVLEASGIRPEDARLASDVLIWASLRGVDTHGIRNLKRYYIDSAAGVGRRDGVIIPTAELTTEMESETTAALNANGGLGLAVSVRAMELAIAKADQFGVGMVTVRNSTHFGPAGYYAHQAVKHDMIGFASTGYFFPCGQRQAVVPFGSLLPMLSTNPIAMAFPADESPPFVLDMSTSVVPVNRMEMLEEQGKSIPVGWALDDQHQPARTRESASRIIPLGGATEYGGHKGYGLALAGWLLTGLLSGAWRRDPEAGRVLGDPPNCKDGFGQEGIGHSFAAVRLDRFGDPTVFKSGVDTMVRAINDAPAADGFAGVFVPGQLADRTAIERTETGIPLPPATLADLRSLSEQFGIPLPLSDPIES